MTAASRPLATGLWGARFAGDWLPSCYTAWGDRTARAFAEPVTSRLCTDHLQAKSMEGQITLGKVLHRLNGTSGEHELFFPSRRKTMPKRDLNKDPPPAHDMPSNIKHDPDRDLSEVPGSYNPGNQAGKGSDFGDDSKQEPSCKPEPDRHKEKPKP